MASTEESNAATNAATHIMKVDSRAAVIVEPHITNAQNISGIANHNAEQRCHNIGMAAVRNALRILGTSDSRWVAPLACR